MPTRAISPVLRVSAKTAGLVRLQGQLTAASGDALLDALRSAALQNTRRVVLDLSHVTRLDRGGAAALLDACVATALRRGTLSLTGLTSRRHAALERIGVLKVIDVVESAPAWPGHIARKECSS